MDLSHADLAELKDALKDLRSAARTIAKLIDKLEPQSPCTSCNDTGTLSSRLPSGERVSTFCHCTKGQRLREVTITSTSSRDRAAGKD
jgi:hypothetical protein